MGRFRDLGVVDLNNNRSKKSLEALFINQFDYFLFDCDGVLWCGEKLIPGAFDAVLQLQNLGKKLYFLTNNSTRSRAEYISKFKNFGLVVELNQVITSSYLAALYLQSKLEGQQSAKKVFAIGQSGLIEELSNVGIEVECAQSEHPFDGEKFKAWKPDDKVFAVVAGLDKNMSYLNLSKAICYLQDPRILFIATNTDATYPCGGGRLAPGCGCLVKFLEYAVNRTSIVMGKPSKVLADYVTHRLELDVSKTCMVGDRLETDILFGKSIGAKTLLVFTGVQRPDSLENNEGSIYPNYCINSVGDLWTPPD
ncbi:uncharacterized protein LOC135143645 [Zophobas morio]|uniref:uncharacterized protein LOC135143645 n=1 Tax=Zophobas morio TaxID=2755281 RepID=UPI003082E30E